jgi:hypothetical protein
MSCDLLCLIFCQFFGNYKRETVDEKLMNTANYCFKVKNKNVTMLHNSKQELSLKKKMYDEAQILYSSTNSISLK